MLKHCPACGVDKSITDFGKQKRRADGLRHVCRQCNRDAARRWREANPERVKATVSRWQTANKTHHRTLQRRWAQKNPEVHRRVEANRRAAKRLAMPPWTDQSAIDVIYRKAELLDMHVDHIVPLQSALVCGLHVPANLQLLERADNQSKGNRHWPEMP